MPTLSEMNIPTPKSWNEFQAITTSALKIRWSNQNFQEYGRGGQAQQGVDIYGHDDLGRSVGVQCKNKTVLTSDEADAEIKLAENFQPALDNYFFAISGPRDAKIQTYLRTLSDERLKNGKFPVGVLFWDDLIQDLASVPQEFSKHFPQLRLKEEFSISLTNHPVSALETAYWGLGLNHYLNLIFGEIGVRYAQEDPEQYYRLLRTLKTTLMYMMDSDEHKRVSEFIDKIISDVKEAYIGKIEWQPVENKVTELKRIILDLEHNLEGEALVAFIMGKAIRRWDSIIVAVSEESLSKEIVKPLLLCCNKLFEDEVTSEIQALIDEYNKDPSSMYVTDMGFQAFCKASEALTMKRLEQTILNSQ